MEPCTWRTTSVGAQPRSIKASTLRAPPMEAILSAQYSPITAAPLSPTGYVFNDGKQYSKADNAGHAFRNAQFPVIAVSPTNPDTVYAVWNHYKPGWDTTYMAACCRGDLTPREFAAGDIAFATSTDGGQTWSEPTRLNDDPLNNGRNQVLPWLVATADGTLHASWYDRRDDPANIQYHVYYSRSTDGGHTWSPRTCKSRTCLPTRVACFIHPVTLS